MDILRPTYWQHDRYGRALFFGPAHAGRVYFLPKSRVWRAAKFAIGFHTKLGERDFESQEAARRWVEMAP